MTSPARPSVRNWAKRRSIRLMTAARLRTAAVPAACGRDARGPERDNPVPASQFDPEMVGDGEDVLVAAAAHVHHHEVVARQGWGDLGDVSERMRRPHAR